jgi:ArsR family transcriptional regulator
MLSPLSSLCPQVTAGTAFRAPRGWALEVGSRGVVSVPLYQAKAEFFRMLGHPVRIRVLELLQDGPTPVRDLLAAIEVEPSSLSQQLAVLRRSGIVASTREGSTVVYELAGGDVADLMRAARRILTEMLAGRNELLAQLQEAEVTPR